MQGFYERWIDRWETRLATRDKNRIVRPMEWGFDWLPGAPQNPDDPAGAMRQYVAEKLADSEEFFSYETPKDFALSGGNLTFTSAVESPYPRNDCVLGQYFPAKRNRGRAVIVLPQWNSDLQGHVGLCKLLNRFGLTALRMSLAYHDSRMPQGFERADFHMSSNIGRTIAATRQSVIDVRSCLDWLEQQGYDRLAILGSSLGSCIAFIAAAHDPRIQIGVFNHVSMYVSDVVWTGISTRHIKGSFEGTVSEEDLRQYWSLVSPAAYLDRMQRRRLKSLLIWAKYDTTFLPRFSLQVLEKFRSMALDHQVFSLPCAHYTTGELPFNVMDGWVMSRFLHRWL
jgi:hypothetical protein